jgi:signal transduction histidine kinase
MSGEKENPIKIPVVKFIIFASIIIILINLVILIYRGFSSYNSEIQAESYEIKKLTKTTGDHIELTMLAADVVLKRAVERHHFNQLFGNNLSRDTQNNIISWVDETPQISAMLTADENGRISAIYRKIGYKPWMEGKVEISDEEYFKYHEDNFDKLHISKQKSFLKNHKGFVVLSRRLDKIDGSFDGIILAVINVEYFTNFFKSIETKRNTKLFIKHNNGDELILPEIISKGEEGLDFRKSEREYTDYINNTPPKEESYIADNDRILPDDLRLYSFYDIPHLNIKVGLVVYGSDLINDWFEDRLSDFVIFIIFILFVFIVSFFTIELAKKVQKLRESERNALAASKAKSDFLANMSHELRTPLNAIIGFSEMLMSEYFGKINNKQRERLVDINSCGNHLLSLINDILEFSKGQAGKLEIRPEEVAFRKVVREAIRMFEERAKAEGISIITNMSKDSPHIMVDKRKMKQVMINLISNSVKFCSNGDVVEVYDKYDEHGNYSIYVKDTGEGMNPSDIPKALSAFGQVSENKASGGTGLGLPICRLFVELHNGDIKIESGIGKGTEVEIKLPAKIIVEH